MRRRKGLQAFSFPHDEQSPRRKGTADGKFQRASLHFSNGGTQWDLVKAPLTISIPSWSPSTVVDGLQEKMSKVGGGVREPRCIPLTEEHSRAS